MGNSQSRASERKWSSSRTRELPPGAESSRVLFLLYLIHRTWNVVLDHVDSKSGRWRGSTLSGLKEEQISDVDSESGSTYSFCSCTYCRASHWGTCSDISQTEMANCGYDEHEVPKEKQRPPIYNPEDYALSLRKWGKKSPPGAPGLYQALSEPTQAPQKASTLPNSAKDFKNPSLVGSGEEMSLRQFGSPGELLTKLRTDLRHAFPSFVQEFASEPLDGVTLLLQLLRNVQLSRSGENTRVTPALQRRALLDELACLQCVWCCCARYPESARRLVAGSCTLYSLTVCIMSTVNKSRIIALQLLTKACNPPANGHVAISEALSTLRLRYGEPVRFRFLVGMLQGAGAPLQAAGLAFFNTLLASAPAPQRKLYLQAELEQAGLDIVAFKKMISKQPTSNESVMKEIEKYERQLIDVDTLSEKASEAQKEREDLKSKLELMEKRVKILQEEKGILISLEKCLKEKCCELQEEVSSLRSEHGNSNRKKVFTKKSHRDESSPPEDEGISSSERSLSPEGDLQRESKVYEVFNVKNETFDVVRNKRPLHKKIETNKSYEYNKSSEEEEETTIDEVIQELRNIVNDAESEQYAKDKSALGDDKSSRYNQTSEINVSIKAMEAQRHRTAEKADSVTSTRHSIHILDSTDHLDEKSEEEAEIVPSKIVPHPPRKAKSLIHLFLPPTEQGLMYNKRPELYDDTYYSSNEDSDSLLSGSKFDNHITKKPTNTNVDFQECRAMFSNMIESRERNVERDLKKRSRTKSGEDICRKASLKRSESFQTSEAGSNNDRLIHRRDQINSLFYIENKSANVGTVTTQLQRSDSRSSRKEEVTPSLAETKKITKSLDRIDEGLNSMVDIVMMTEAKKIEWPYENRRSASRKSSDTQDSYIQVSRANNKQANGYGHQIFDSRTSSGKGRDEVSFTKIDPNQKFFIPHPKLSTGSFDNRSISSYNNTSFLVKRGHANAGFYSGQNFLHNTPHSMNSLVITGSNHGEYNRALSPVGPKSISSHVMGVPKVTDMPSGLY